jgi:hypothetical protein
MNEQYARLLRRAIDDLKQRAEYAYRQHQRTVDKQKADETIAAVTDIVSKNRHEPAVNRILEALESWRVNRSAVDLQTVVRKEATQARDILVAQWQSAGSLADALAPWPIPSIYQMMAVRLADYYLVEAASDLKWQRENLRETNCLLEDLDRAESRNKQ